MIWVYVLFLVVYGLARATQQSNIFIYKNGEDPLWWNDESKEIHFFGWFEPISLVISSMSIYNVLSGRSWIEWLLFAFASYWLYYLPYGLLYNYCRERKWFASGQVYNVLSIKVLLPTYRIAITMWCVSIVFATSYWWWRMYV
jgi:hypothetical protein